MVVFPQDEHEPLLIDTLAQRGVTLERRTEIVSLTNGNDGVRATLKLLTARKKPATRCLSPAATARVRAFARSRVRESLDIGFPGGTYKHLFYVADVEASGPVINGELHAVLDDADFLAVFPLKGEKRGRLIGTVRDDMAAKQEPLPWNHISST